MADVTRMLEADELTIPEGHAWTKLPWRGLQIGAVGLVASVVIALVTGSGKQFYFSWLVAFLFFLSIALGGLFFVLSLYLTRAGWGVTLRRSAENVMATLPFFALLWLPILVGNHSLYHWTHADALAHDPLLQAKAPYLNFWFFLVRAVVYFAIWTWLSRWFSMQSEAQDRTGDPAITVKLQSRSAPGMIAFALTTTFASIDWMMSLDPHWYSTIFGVYFFAGSCLAVFSFLVASSIALHRAGFAQRTISVEHVHDLGKLLFGFTVFWAYIGFSQYFLIWYANIPEETAWYLHRSHGSWRELTILLCVGHFAVPFFFFMPRAVKRSPRWLLAGSIWMLCMHYIDLHWQVMPILHPHGVHPTLLDATTFLAVGGVFLAVFARVQARRALVPVRDPRLPEALSFENV